MENRAHRTPSPAHPLQHGYQLEDNPYGHPQLDIPIGPGRYSPGDALQMQTAVSALCYGGTGLSLRSELTKAAAIRRQPRGILGQPRGAP